MSLHHRREMDDIRAAYTHPEPGTRTQPWPADQPRAHREISMGGLDQSFSTPPPVYTSRSLPVRKPTGTNNVIHYDTPDRYFDDRQFQDSPKSSEETIASTVQSEEDFTEDLRDYDVPELLVRPCSDGSRVLESTPKDFSSLFPSSKQLFVRHDDTTLDGNMNLRIDTVVQSHGSLYDMTLFHLRMHDLKSRDFSLRRHHRDSGREVCHSLSKASPPKRPGFQRSLSNALHSMRPKFEHRSSTSPSLTRHDSGYGSMHSMDSSEAHRPASSGRGAGTSEESLTNTIKLEFSNYAQVEVRRAGTNSTRYEFEYWGVHYQWKRVSRKTADSPRKMVSFHLKRVGSDTVLASIEPMSLTPRQAQEERSKGGWIPPCTLQINDDAILSSQKDVSDVIVAAGLMALVDDSIRARFLSKSEKQLLVPNIISNLHVQQIGPKQLINEMFNRKEHQMPVEREPPSLSSSDGGDYEGRRPGQSRRANYTF